MPCDTMQTAGRCHQVPHLPRKSQMNVSKCHACHAKRWCMTTSCVPRLRRKTKVDVSKCTPATQMACCWMSPSATPATQIADECLQVPRLPRKTTVSVALCHICQAECRGCHARWRWMSPSATPATQSAAASPATKPAQARHQSQPSAISATPTTQNQGRKVDAYKCHACHAKPR